MRTAEEVQVSAEGEITDAGPTRLAVKAQEKGIAANQKTDAKEDRAAKEQGNVRRRSRCPSGASHGVRCLTPLGHVGPRRRRKRRDVITQHHCARAPQQGHYHVRFCLPIQVSCSLRYSSWAVGGSRFRRAPDPSCSYLTVAKCSHQQLVS